ncbi:MAG: orotate phosphoribosyltransferase, partial [Alloprevotella sp.]
SGWKSPFYCDNRKTLAFPGLRSFVKLELSRLVAELYPEADAIAGVATGAIAQGALVADALSLPFAYVRSKAKDHGMANLIEGDLQPGMKVVVIEDLISTGGSSLKAVEALRAHGCEVIGMVASYTYGFPVAEEAFKAAGVTLTTLTNYEAVVEVALQTGYIKSEHVELLHQWRQNPSEWGK